MLIHTKKKLLKELIREGKPRDFIMDRIKQEFKGLVNPTTPYEWWKDIIKQQDIQEWEKENKKEVISLYDHKRKAKMDMYYWTYNRYLKKKNKLEESDPTNEDPELIKEIYDLQDRLQPYLKKVE
jgi:asparagine synthetase B (glutamine-hydrolysing)